jgi:DNA polymerase III gamma/tau subunit
MNQKLPVHPTTWRQTSKYLGSPLHALILVGQPGSGKSFLGNYIAGQLLGDSRLDRYRNSGHLLVAEVQDGKTEVSIDAIRGIISELSKKTAAAKAKRVVLIKNAGLMSDEAQNALLKTLEQPGADIYFIMGADSKSALLPTIYSRAVIINLQPISLKEAISHYQKAYSTADIERSWQLSEGKAARLDQLLSGEAQPVLSMIDEAKAFLALKPYERLIKLELIAKDRSQLILFLEALQRLLKAAHHNSLRSKLPAARRILSSRKVVNEALKRLEANASPKLVGIDLVAGLTV